MHEQVRSLGGRLQRLRHLAHLTQEQLASRANITANFVAHLERGTRRPSLETLVDLAGALGVGIGALFGEGEPGAKHELSAELQRLCTIIKKVPPARYPALEDLATSLVPR